MLWCWYCGLWAPERGTLYAALLILLAVLQPALFLADSGSLTGILCKLRCLLPGEIADDRGLGEICGRAGGFSYLLFAVLKFLFRRNCGTAGLADIVDYLRTDFIHILALMLGFCGFDSFVELRGGQRHGNTLL